MEMADSFLLIMSIFTIMLAVSQSGRLVAWVALLQAADLPLDFFWYKSRQDGEEVLHHVGMNKKDCLVLFWTWWALELSPLRPINVLLCFISGVGAVSMGAIV